MFAHPLRFPYRSELALPVIGLEAEFEVFIDGARVAPEEYWRTTSAFIEGALLQRASKAVQLPSGGALYFDGGVLEVVTPVIELASHCSGRVVRSLWEQIDFVREQLNRWERATGTTVRLQAFSCHFNVSFELPRAMRGRNRTIQKLSVLLSHLLPVPVLVTGANRRSTGIGVRPRRDRIEITMDFTPDPGLMAATTALIVGIVRDVIEWPSYRLDELDRRGIPHLANLVPGPHPSRKGWVAKKEHFPRDPFVADLDAREWLTTDGRARSLRQLALATALPFRNSIRAWSDPFSIRLLLSVLRGQTPSLLDLDDRPPEYDDVGRATRWGTVLPELRNFGSLLVDAGEGTAIRRRLGDVSAQLAPPWDAIEPDRRRARRPHERRRLPFPAPARQLSRSSYEKVFIALGSLKRLHLGGECLTPIGVRGWYHALFRNQDGEERLLSIDQLLDHLGSFR